MKPEMEKLAEVRGQGGDVLFTVWLSANRTAEVGGLIESGASDREKGKNDQGQRVNDDPMTDSQKRYLFRLLAEKGIEGEAAYKRLKKDFGVESLKEISKVEASRAIDHILSGEWEVGDHGNEMRT